VTLSDDRRVRHALGTGGHIPSLRIGRGGVGFDGECSGSHGYGARSVSPSPKIPSRIAPIIDEAARSGCREGGLDELWTRAVGPVAINGQHGNGHNGRTVDPERWTL